MMKWMAPGSPWNRTPFYESIGAFLVIRFFLFHLIVYHHKVMVLEVNIVSFYIPVAIHETILGNRYLTAKCFLNNF